MKNIAAQSKSSSTVKPKGDRLHWTPLHELKAVVLSDDLTAGRQLEASDLLKRNNNMHSSNLIP